MWDSYCTNKLQYYYHRITIKLQFTKNTTLSECTKQLVALQIYSGPFVKDTPQKFVVLHPASRLPTFNLLPHPANIYTLEIVTRYAYQIPCVHE